MSAEKQKETERKILFGLFSTAFSVVLLGLVLYNSLSISAMQETVTQAKAILKENEPIKIDLVTITQPGCNQCSGTKDIVSLIKSANVNVTSEKNLESSSEDAKALIQKYGIKKLPTIIVFGATDKTGLKENWSELGTIAVNTLVYTNVKPPFFDLESGKLLGAVSIVAIKKDSCVGCANIDPMLSAISNIVYVESNKTLDYNSAEAEALIQKYGIGRIPAIILSSGAKEYPQIVSGWQSIGDITESGDFVTRSFPVPYFDLGSNAVFGLVEMTTLTDGNCSDCLDLSDFKKAIEGFGVKVVWDKVFDINSSEAKKLLKDYNITAVPTVLLSSEANKYPGFVTAWEQVGSVEKDGVFILRGLDVLGGKYKQIGQ